MSKKKLQRRPDGAEWREAEIMWASGDHTQSEIADKLGVSGQSVYQHMRKAKIEKGSMREQLMEEASKKSAELMAEEMEKLMEDVIASKKLAVKSSLALQRLATKKIKEASDKGLPISSIHADVKCIMDLIKVNDFANALVERATGADEISPADSGLETLTFHDLTEKDIEKMREDQRKELAMINGEDVDDAFDDVEVEEL